MEQIQKIQKMLVTIALSLILIFFILVMLRGIYGGIRGVIEGIEQEEVEKIVEHGEKIIENGEKVIEAYENETPLNYTQYFQEVPLCDEQAGLLDLEMKLLEKYGNQIEVKNIQKHEELSYDESEGVRSCAAWIGMTFKGSMIIGAVGYSFKKGTDKPFITTIDGLQILDPIAR